MEHSVCHASPQLFHSNEDTAMKIVYNGDDVARLDLSVDNLRLFQAGLREIGETIDDFEFFARVGGTKETVYELCVELRELMEEAGIDL